MEKPAADGYKNKALKTMAAGSMIVFVGMMADRVLGYITRIILARGLAPSEYGMFFLALSFLSIGIAISVIGLPGALERYVAYYHGRGDSRRVRGIVNSAFRLSVPIAVAVFAVLFGLSDILSNDVFGNPGLSPLIKVLSFAVLAAPFIRLSLGTTTGFRKAKYEVMIRALFKSVLTLIAVVAALYFGFGVIGTGLAYMLGFVFTGILAFYFMSRLLNRMTGSERRSIPMKGKLLSFSVPLVFAGFVWNILSQADTIILGVFKSEIDVGLYHVVLPNAQLLLVVPVAIYYLLLPTISDLFAKNKKNDIKSIYKTVARLGFYFNFPLFLIVFVFPNEVITFIFGSNYLVGGMVGYAQSILAVGFFIYSFSRISNAVISLYERTGLWLLNAILTLGSNVLLDIILVPLYGVIGAAVATTISFIFFSILNIAEGFYISKPRMHPFDWGILKSVFSGAVSIIIIYVLSISFLGMGNIIHFFIWVFAFFLVYAFVLVISGGLRKEDLRLLKLIERKLGLNVGWLFRIVDRFSK